MAEGNDADLSQSEAGRLAWICKNGQSCALFICLCYSTLGIVVGSLLSQFTSRALHLPHVVSAIASDVALLTAPQRMKKKEQFKSMEDSVVAYQQERKALVQQLYILQQQLNSVAWEAAELRKQLGIENPPP